MALSTVRIEALRPLRWNQLVYSEGPWGLVCGSGVAIGAERQPEESVRPLHHSSLCVSLEKRGEGNAHGTAQSLFGSTMPSRYLAVGGGFT